MMKNKKVPMRKCVVTQERYPKKELIRVVKNNSGEIFVDPTGKANGRGAYLKLSKQVINQAKKKKVFERVFEMEIPDSVFEELLSEYEKQNS